MTDVASEPARRTSLLPIVAGNVFEWFDFTVYGFFATTIASQFFPPGDEQAALLGSAAVFGVAFVMRPLGAVVFGLVGDRCGRKTSLTLTFALMAVGTAMIGLAPSYATAGILATVVLLLGRLLQGFSASGEAGSALTMMVESTPKNRRGVAVAWLNVGVYSAVVLGSLAGLLVTSSLPAAAAQAWGWRVPFLLGLLIAPIGLYLRRHMDESRAFLALRHSQEGSSRAAPHDPRRMLRGVTTVIGLAGFGSPIVYLILIFMPGYAARELHLPPEAPMLSTLIASLVLVLLLVPMGRLCDRVGGNKPLIVASCLVGSGLVVPLMSHLTNAPSLAALLLLQCSVSICLALYVAACGPVVVELFPVERRALGVGLGYNLGIMIFGAFAPAITTWLISVTGDSMVPAWYALSGGLISAMVALSLPNEREAVVADYGRQS